MSLPDDLKNLFKPEDFQGCSLHFGQLTAVIERANAILAERLGEVREVRKNTRRTSMWRLKAYPEDTHTAYLVGVREL